MAKCKYCKAQIIWEENKGGFRPLDPDNFTLHRCGKNCAPEFTLERRRVHGHFVWVKVYPSVPVLASSHKTRWHFKNSFNNIKDFRKLLKRRRKREEKFKRHRTVVALLPDTNSSSRKKDHGNRSQWAACRKGRERGNKEPANEKRAQLFPGKNGQGRSWEADQKCQRAHDSCRNEGGACATMHDPSRPNTSGSGPALATS